MNRFRSKPITYGRHSISRKDIGAVKKVLRGEWLTRGPQVELFERELSEFIGSDTCVVSSGTAALHCAYYAIGISPGDEVITPSITFMATQATAVLLGAKIVFADVNPKSGLIDPSSVRSLITKKTKAVVAVDYAGIPADIDALKQICQEYNLFLIQDAAHSIGARYRGTKIGSLADVTVFSFFPTKNMTTGEGGAISSDNINILQRARIFARHGTIRNRDSFLLDFQGGWHNEFHSFGLNYRLNDVMCALGRSQLSRLDSFIRARRDIASYYFKTLKNLESVELPDVDPEIEPAWHFFPILVRPEIRSHVYNELHKSGIRVQVNYIPVHLQPVFAAMNYNGVNCPGANEFYAREISLPVHPGLTNRDVRRISDRLIRLLY